jgi:hypothetical protein
MLRRHHGMDVYQCRRRPLDNLLEHRQLLGKDRAYQTDRRAASLLGRWVRDCKPCVFLQPVKQISSVDTAYQCILVLHPVAGRKG